MSNISIDKNITPGKKITFKISMSFFGYIKETELTLTAPNASPLLNRIDNIKLKSEPGPPKTKTKGTFNFSKYAKSTSIDNNNYKLKLLLNNVKKAAELEPGETVLFTSSSPKLSQLNNKNFEVIKDNNKDPRYVYLRVRNTFSPSPNSGTANGSLAEVTGVQKTRKFTIILPKNVFKGLITEKSTGSIKKGNVEDIPIFAYKRFKGKNTSEIKKKLIINGSEINEKSPPNRNDVVEYIGKESYSKIFDINDEEKFIFYVAIARYIYNGKSWNKEWLQANSSGEALWGKATEGKKN